jgi:hypothetical protein
MSGQDVRARTGAAPHRILRSGTSGYIARARAWPTMTDMIQDAGRRLLFAFQRPETAPGDAGAAGDLDRSRHPMVDFVAYADDCVLSGRVRLSAERMTDLLNEHEEIQLVDVMVQRLRDAGALEAAEILVRRDEILFVHAAGPRGEAGRRRRTLLHPLAMQLGPYQIRGYLHALPGSPPLVAIRSRQPMVPLTDAWIEYDDGSMHHGHRVGAIVVNRDRIDWIVPAQEGEMEIRDTGRWCEGPFAEAHFG